MVGTFTPVKPQTWREKLAESQKLFDQAKTIILNPESPAEERNRVQEMLNEARSLKADGMNLKEIEESGLSQVLGEAEQKNTPDSPLTDREVKYWERLTLLGRALRDSGDRRLTKAMVEEIFGRDEKRFADWGEYLYASWKAQHPRFMREPHDPRLLWFREQEEKSHSHKDMGGQSGAGGGFLIPAEFQAQLMAVVGERSIVRSRATIIRMRRRQIDIPVLDQTGTTAGVGHWFGGMLFYWAEEGSEKTPSDPSFKAISLVARKLIGLTRASDELVDDSAISLGDFLSGPLGMAGGVSWMEDYAFLRGTGAGQPLGVINAGATFVQPRAVAGAVSFVDICNMMEHFLPSGNGVWVISQSMLPDILQLSGPSGNASYVWIPNARDGVPSTIFGYPVVWSEKPPAKGGQGDIGLYDFKYYLVGDRQATTIDSTIFEKWAEDKTSWRVVHRVDGQPWLSAPLTLQDGTTQVSPFVILGAGSGS